MRPAPSEGVPVRLDALDASRALALDTLKPRLFQGSALDAAGRDGRGGATAPAGSKKRPEAGEGAGM